MEEVCGGFSEDTMPPALTYSRGNDYDSAQKMCCRSPMGRTQPNMAD